MPLCWHCNTKVQFLDDGWICPICGQHGPPDRIAETYEEGCRLNIPYIERTP